MPRLIRNYLPILFISIVTWCIQVQAAPGGDSGNGKNNKVAVRKLVTLDEAVIQIKRDTNGRILTAETVTRKGKEVHRIKVLLPSGDIKVQYVKAE